MRQLNPARVIGRVVAPCFAVLLLRQVFCYIKGDDEITLEKKKEERKRRENNKDWLSSNDSESERRNERGSQVF